ncbi:MAG: bifunctional precorrin-2 dehydrogenase/sirohydrochlorin ferrochelatase [Deltaproteobacteria bacterium]|nr:bifunctional precorrin-2 dehydrogenase/sirohydrochlorin ferrochelatase [Deltaproteobacteria bacterium]MBI2209865.1 bifunctional precorrin-2 dehydrogenase/sirohydrochlorin ferrochelatase [Deltaproteobacteria bacterium]
MAYYPIFLNLTGQPCIVIGGGAVAERKMEGLLQAGARITVVSPALTSKLISLAARGAVRHICRQYQSGDLRDHALAFVATDDPEISREVAREGRDLGVWVNAADDPAHCDFILPSVLRRGELVVAVATGGSSPALSRAIREELEAYITEDYAALTEIVAEVRQKLKEHSLTPSAETWQKALNGDLRRFIREGKQGKARNYLLKQLGVET